MPTQDVYILTTAELTAAKLRRQAEELLLLADELEATVPDRPSSRKRHTFKNPLTGKVSKIKKGEMEW